MVALQISPKIESLYGLGGQATKLWGFVWNFATLKPSRVASHLLPFQF